MLVAHTCSSGSSWQGWVEAEEGMSSFSLRLEGPCRHHTGTFIYSLYEDKYRLIYARWTGAVVRISDKMFDYPVEFKASKASENSHVKRKDMTFIYFKKKISNAFSPAVRLDRLSTYEGGKLRIHPFCSPDSFSSVFFLRSNYFKIIQIKLLPLLTTLWALTEEALYIQKLNV